MSFRSSVLFLKSFCPDNRSKRCRHALMSALKKKKNSDYQSILKRFQAKDRNIPISHRTRVGRAFNTENINTETTSFKKITPKMLFFRQNTSKIPEL